MLWQQLAGSANFSSANFSTAVLLPSYKNKSLTNKLAALGHQARPPAAISADANQSTKATGANQLAGLLKEERNYLPGWQFWLLLSKQVSSRLAWRVHTVGAAT
jgi:hypothetical protein